MCCLENIHSFDADKALDKAIFVHYVFTLVPKSYLFIGARGKRKIEIKWREQREITREIGTDCSASA